MIFQCNELKETPKCTLGRECMKISLCFELQPEWKLSLKMQKFLSDMKELLNTSQMILYGDFFQ